MSSLTRRDNHQIERHEHDESHDAKRVYVVGGKDIKINADASQITEAISLAIKESISEIIPSFNREISDKVQVVEIEKPFFIKEPHVIETEKQVVVKEKELVYVDKPVIVEKIIYKEIEKPVFLNNESKISHKLYLTTIGLLLVQTLILFGIVVFKI